MARHDEPRPQRGSANWRSPPPRPATYIDDCFVYSELYIDVWPFQVDCASLTLAFGADTPGKVKCVLDKSGTVADAAGIASLASMYDSESEPSDEDGADSAQDGDDDLPPLPPPAFAPLGVAPLGGIYAIMDDAAMDDAAMEEADMDDAALDEDVDVGDIDDDALDGEDIAPDMIVFNHAGIKWQDTYIGYWRCSCEFPERVLTRELFGPTYIHNAPQAG